MRVPFEPGFVYEGRATDCDLADVVCEGVLGADGAEEGVPAWVPLEVLPVHIGSIDLPSAILGACNRVKSSGMRPIAPRRALTRSRTS